MKPLAVGLLLTVLACSNPTGSATTAATGEAEPDRLIGDLAAASAEAEQVETFASDPIGGEGLLLCVGAEEVRVYLFGTNEEAAATAARIDPTTHQTWATPSSNGLELPVSGGGDRCSSSTWARIRQLRT